ncbi:recombinase family protein [Geodermatophilus sp. CPCC 205761]|uniref:recombinase family protein n=1 Tax=Geodermatophilus sp. CPCC 205761 TaxID=2936597 RepID=UPI003EE9AFBE
MSRRVIIYTRMSKDREGAGLGVDRQWQDCVELVERLGWQVVGHRTDNDLSAYSGKPRPDYQALLDDLEAGRADAVVVWHTDRLHRRPDELEHYIGVCDPRGVVTQTVKAGPLDLATPSGRMVARMLGTAARYEVEHAIERMQTAKRQAATSGRWKGGRRPFGYESDGVTVRETEAAEIRKGADALLAGMSLRALAREWNARGVTTSTGGPWKPTEVRKLLARPRNAGLMEHRGEVVGPAEWPAIVDEPVWRAVRALLADEGRRTTTGNARRWLGGGLYLCGVCQKPLRASTTGTGRQGRSVAAYRCDEGAHVVRRCADLDFFVEMSVVAKLVDAHVTPPVVTEDTAAIYTERLDVQNRLTELVDLFTGRKITGAQMERGTATLQAQLDELNQRLAAAAGSSALDGVAGPDAATVWPTLDLSRQRAIIEALVTVTVHRTRRGRPQGWKPGDSYFDPRGIDLDWIGSEIVEQERSA